MHRYLLVLVLVLLSLPLGPVQTLALDGADGEGEASVATAARTLTRTVDPVIVQGKELPGMSGRPLASLRAFALRDGRLEAIPYQIDEFDEKGRITCPEGKDPRKDEDEGHLDSNDEVVVMAADLGDKAPRRIFPRDARAASEVRVQDPTSGTQAWFYVFDFDSPPPPSPVEYVQYDPTEDKASSDLYLVDFNERRSILLDDMRIKGKDGKLGVNIIDRIKVRTWFKSRIFITFKFNEEDITSHVTAHKNGPIRSVRSADYFLKLLFIKVTPSAHVDYLFYRNAIVGPGELKVPFNPKLVLRGGSRAVTGLDFDEAVRGWQFYSARNPNPIVLDGINKTGDGLEKKDVNWFALFGEEGGTMTRVVYGPSILKAKQGYDLYYVDDLDQDGSPERTKGETMFGFTMDLLKLPRGAHQLWFYQYFASPFTMGDEVKFNDILDHALEPRALAVSVPRDGMATPSAAGSDPGENGEALPAHGGKAGEAADREG
ncbi:MAG: hypothetical protein Q8R92_18185 [Deltaproteobacteria bacterium]|nr:hypothetical protein [Deltaproteobacteria bacterium]